MPIVPTGFITQTQLDSEVNRAILKLGPEVVRVRYRVGEDTGGDPCKKTWGLITYTSVRSESEQKMRTEPEWT